MFVYMFASFSSAGLRRSRRCWKAGTASRCENLMLAVSPRRGSSRWSDAGSELHPPETASSPAIDGFVTVRRLGW
jgi:hypothetical protein